MDRMLRLREKTCKQLDKCGYKWKMTEGELFVTKSDCHFRIRFHRTMDRFVTLVVVDYMFAADELEGANENVLNAILCKVNYDNAFVKFLQLEEAGFLCRFMYPMLMTSKFVNIFEFAFGEVMEAVKEFYNDIDALKQDLKPVTNSIGFIRPERDGETKVVAETKKNE